MRGLAISECLKGLAPSLFLSFFSCDRSGFGATPPFRRHDQSNLQLQIDEIGNIARCVRVKPASSVAAIEPSKQYIDVENGTGIEEWTTSLFYRWRLKTLDGAIHASLRPTCYAKSRTTAAFQSLASGIEYVIYYIFMYLTCPRFSIRAGGPLPHLGLITYKRDPRRLAQQPAVIFIRDSKPQPQTWQPSARLSQSCSRSSIPSSSPG